MAPGHDRDGDLRAQAAARGIELRYRGTDRTWHEPSIDALRAAVASLAELPAASAGWPPLVVTRRGRTPSLPRRHGAPVQVTLESGERRDSLRGLPIGYHLVEAADHRCTVAICPERCHLPARLARGGRAWGIALQLYALRSQTSRGIGNLSDLAGLATLAPRLGDPAFLLVNPLAAPLPGLPRDPSPYRPSSRLWGDPLYLDVDAVPEARLLAGAERARFEELRRAGRALNAGRLIDRDAAAALADEALRLCFDALPDGRRDMLARFVAAMPGLGDFAAFCARGGQPGDAPAREVTWHAYLQLLLDEQRAALPPLGIGLISDIPVGFSPEGFDAWAQRHLLAPGMSVGAPPDALGPAGQDWAIPALVPWRLRADGYRPFIELLRASMRHAGGVRLDHVMGLFRLFLVPHGGTPADGVYLRYPHEDLLGLLALESVRARALVIGEDLGTVEDGVRDRLAACRVLGYRVAWFERRPPREWPRLALAAATTHDTATVRGAFDGSDLAQLEAIGALPPGREEAVADAYRANVERVRAALTAEGLSRADPAIGIHELLARTPSLLVAASLDDMLGARERVNAPGTVTERPNWQVPLPVPLEGIAEHPLAQGVAAALKGVR